MHRGLVSAQLCFCSFYLIWPETAPPLHLPPPNPPAEVEWFSFTLRLVYPRRKNSRCPFYMNLNGLQSRCGRCQEQNNIYSLWQKFRMLTKWKYSLTALGGRLWSVHRRSTGRRYVDCWRRHLFGNVLRRCLGTAVNSTSIKTLAGSTTDWSGCSKKAGQLVSTRLIVWMLINILNHSRVGMWVNQCLATNGTV